MSEPPSNLERLMYYGTYLLIGYGVISLILDLINLIGGF